MLDPYLLAKPELTILAISSLRSQYLSSFSLPFLFRQNIKYSAMVLRDWIHLYQIIILWRHFISRSSKPLLVFIYRKPTFGDFCLSFLEMHRPCFSRFFLLLYWYITPLCSSRWQDDMSNECSIKSWRKECVLLVVRCRMANGRMRGPWPTEEVLLTTRTYDTALGRFLHKIWRV